MGEDEPGEAGRWKFSSVGEAAMYAEEAADIIVEVMRKLSGNLLVNSVDSEIYKAMAYVSDPPPALPPPTTSIRSRSSEAYFFLWAQTSAGKKEVAKWAGVDAARMSKDFKVPQFLREILTRETKMYKEWAGDGMAFSADQKMALKFLSTSTRSLSPWEALGLMKEFYLNKQSQELQKEELKEMARILGQEAYRHGSIFPVLDWNETLVHVLRIGQEDKIFQGVGELHWYELGRARWVARS